MINFFIWTIIAGFFIGICNGIYETIAQPLKSLPIDVKHVFYNNYEENQKVISSIQSHGFFQSLLSNVVLAALVALLYWIYLFD